MRMTQLCPAMRRACLCCRTTLNRLMHRKTSTPTPQWLMLLLMKRTTSSTILATVLVRRRNLTLRLGRWAGNPRCKRWTWVIPPQRHKDQTCWTHLKATNRLPMRSSQLSMRTMKPLWLPSGARLSPRMISTLTRSSWTRTPKGRRKWTPPPFSAATTRAFWMILTNSHRRLLRPRPLRSPNPPLQPRRAARKVATRPKLRTPRLNRQCRPPPRTPRLFRP